MFSTRVRQAARLLERAPRFVSHWLPIVRMRFRFSRNVQSCCNGLLCMGTRTPGLGVRYSYECAIVRPRSHTASFASCGLRASAFPLPGRARARVARLCSEAYSAWASALSASECDILLRARDRACSFRIAPIFVCFGALDFTDAMNTWITVFRDTHHARRLSRLFGLALLAQYFFHKILFAFRNLRARTRNILFIIILFIILFWTSPVAIKRSFSWLLPVQLLFRTLTLSCL